MTSAQNRHHARVALSAVLIGLGSTGVVFLQPALTGAQAIRWTEEARTVPLPPGIPLRVVNLLGDVEVRSGTEPGAVLHIRRQVPPGPEIPDEEIDRAMPVEVVTGGERVEVRVPRRPLSGWDEPGGGIRRHLRLRIELPVVGIEGPMILDTVDGRLEVRDTGREVRLGTMTGDIVLERSPFGADVNTVSGDVRINGAGGGITVTCVSGDIVIEEARAVSVRASNTGGNITYEGTLAPDGSYRLSSHSGDILFRIHGPQLSTFSGSISVPLDFVLTGERTSRRGLEGTIGSGEAYIELTGFSGNLVLYGPVPPHP
jgi:hypothetical protein